MDMLKLNNASPVDMNIMEIRTEVLEPLTKSDDLVKFVLDKKGILNSGSTISFQIVKSADESNKNCFLPIKTGALSLFKRVILKIGGKTIQTTDEVGLYSTFLRSFKTQEEKLGIDQCMIGSNDRLCNSLENDGTLQMRDADYSNDTTSTCPERLRITSSVDTTPEWSVKLHQLFPMLRNLALPLYLLDEQMTIELVLNKQSSSQNGIIACFTDGTSNTEVKPVLDSFKLLSDHLYYGDDRLEELARSVNSQEGIVIPYTDMNCIRSAYSTTLATSNHDISRDLQLSGQSVKSIVLADVDKTSSNALLGEYHVDAYKRPDSYNLKINDRLMYNKPIERESQKLNELSSVMGRDLHISMPEYSFNGNIDPAGVRTTELISDSTFEGISMKDNLTSSQHWVGIDTTTNPFKEVGNGMRSNKQITFERTVNTKDNESRDLKYFVHIERMLQMRGGYVNVTA